MSGTMKQILDEVMEPDNRAVAREMIRAKIDLLGVIRHKKCEFEIDRDVALFDGDADRVQKLEGSIGRLEVEIRKVENTILDGLS